MRCVKCDREGPFGECIGCGHWNDSVASLDKAFFAHVLGVDEVSSTSVCTEEDRGVEAGLVQSEPHAPLSGTPSLSRDTQRRSAGRPTKGRENGGPGNPCDAGSSPASSFDSAIPRPSNVLPPLGPRTCPVTGDLVDNWMMWHCPDCEREHGRARTNEAWEPEWSISRNINEGRDPRTCPHPKEKVDTGTHPPFCHACAGLVGHERPRTQKEWPKEDHAALVEYAKLHDEDLATIRNLRANIRDLQAQLTASARTDKAVQPRCPPPCGLDPQYGQKDHGMGCPNDPRQSAYGTALFRLGRRTKRTLYRLDAAPGEARETLVGFLDEAHGETIVAMLNEASEARHARTETTENPLEVWAVFMENNKTDELYGLFSTEEKARAYIAKFRAKDPVDGEDLGVRVWVVDGVAVPTGSTQ